MIKTYGGGSWIRDSKEVRFQDAELVIMPGGSDWGTEYYNHEPIKGQSWGNSKLNQQEYDLAKEAIAQGKYVWGNCKGLQLVTILAGGWLIQDMSHGGGHEITTNRGVKFNVNNAHHQLCFPYDLPKEDYELIGWAEQLSRRHIIQGNRQLKFPEIALDENGKFMEPEIIWYPKIKAMGAQFHPEWMSSCKALSFVNDIIREKMGK